MTDVDDCYMISLTLIDIIRKVKTILQYKIQSQIAFQVVEILVLEVLAVRNYDIWDNMQ